MIKLEHYRRQYDIDVHKGLRRRAPGAYQGRQLEHVGPYQDDMLSLRKLSKPEDKKNMRKNINAPADPTSAGQVVKPKNKQTDKDKTDGTA